MQITFNPKKILILPELIEILKILPNYTSPLMIIENSGTLLAPRLLGVANLEQTKFIFEIIKKQHSIVSKIIPNISNLELDDPSYIFYSPINKCSVIASIGSTYPNDYLEKIEYLLNNGVILHPSDHYSILYTLISKGDDNSFEKVFIFIFFSFFIFNLNNKLIN